MQDPVQYYRLHGIPLHLWSHLIQFMTHIETGCDRQLCSHALLFKGQTVKLTGYEYTPDVKCCAWVSEHRTGRCLEDMPAFLASVLLSVFGVKAILNVMSWPTVRAFLYLRFQILIVCCVMSDLFLTKLCNTCTYERQFHRCQLIQKLLCDSHTILPPDFIVWLPSVSGVQYPVHQLNLWKERSFKTNKTLQFK